MRVLFARSRSLSSFLIRSLDWSPFSHCAIDLEDGTVVDSTFRQHGVRMRKLQELLDDSSLCVAYPLRLTEWQRGAAVAFLAAQVGKPYDWSAILGFLARQDWAESDSWFCNELFEAMMLAIGVQRYRYELSRISVRSSWLCVTGLTTSEPVVIKGPIR